MVLIGLEQFLPDLPRFNRSILLNNQFKNVLQIGFYGSDPGFEISIFNEMAKIGRIIHTNTNGRVDIDRFWLKTPILYSLKVSTDRF